MYKCWKAQITENVPHGKSIPVNFSSRAYDTILDWRILPGWLQFDIDLIDWTEPDKSLPVITPNQSGYNKLRNLIPGLVKVNV